MAKTLAQLKRDLAKGVAVTLIESSDPTHPNLGILRHVISVQSNGVSLGKEPNAVKGCFMDFPKASLMEYEGDTLRIYETGIRDLTEQEKKIRDGAPKDEEQTMHDLMTDGSTMYWREKRYFEEQDAEYLRGCGGWSKGKRFNGYTGKVLDESIKGKLDRVYKIG